MIAFGHDTSPAQRGDRATSVIEPNEPGWNLRRLVKVSGWLAELQHVDGLRPVPINDHVFGLNGNAIFGRWLIKARDPQLEEPLAWRSAFPGWQAKLRDDNFPARFHNSKHLLHRSSFVRVILHAKAVQQGVERSVGEREETAVSKDQRGRNRYIAKPSLGSLQHTWRQVSPEDGNPLTSLLSYDGQVVTSASRGFEDGTARWQLKPIDKAVPFPRVIHSPDDIRRRSNRPPKRGDSVPEPPRP